MSEASPLSEVETTVVRDLECALPTEAPVLSIALRLLVAGNAVIYAYRLMMAEGETAKELELAADALRAVHPAHDWNSNAPPDVLVDQYFAKVEERDTQVMEKYRRALELHESRVSKLRDIPRFVARLTQGCDQLRAIIEREVRFPIDDQRRVFALIENLKGALQRGGRFPQDELLCVTRDLRALSKARGELQESATTAPPDRPRTPEEVDALVATLPTLNDRHAWMTGKQAGAALSLANDTMRNYRSDGVAATDGLAGVDMYGRIWRKAHRNAHAVYLKASVEKSKET